MGDLKKEALETNNEDIQQFKLNAGEVNYLRLLNLALQYHTLGQKIMSGFLYYVCVSRLGYKDGSNLQLQFDFDKSDDMLTVKLLPEDLTTINAAPEAPAPPAPPLPPAPKK